MTGDGKSDRKGLTFVLVAACETNFSRSGRLEGDVDVPLTPRGRMRSRRVMEDVLQPLGGVDAVYAAENQGSRETAEILAAANSNRIRVIDDLKGVSLGLWEGQLVADVSHRHSRMWESWRRDPCCITPPEGEEMDRAYRRIRSAVKAIRRRHRSGIVAVVAPETVVSLFYCHLAGRPAREVFEVARQMGRCEIVPPAAGRTGS